MTFEELRDTIVENFNIDADEIKEDSLLQEDLGLDSLDAVELSMEIEEQSGAEIPDEEFVNFKTVGDILNFLQDA